LLIGGDDNAPDSTWYENDGICNTISMSFLGDTKMLPFDGSPKQGVWQVMSRVNMDHQAVVGHGINKNERANLFVLYIDHCKLLYSL